MAGKIWGVVRQNGIAPKESVRVAVVHNLESNRPAICETDQYGLYSVFLDRRGQCELKVFNKNTEIYSRTIPSYKAPMRWDVHLIATPEK